ncbi:hypothetical protein [Gilvimarinus sp. 1_MG-2023]|uniref:hypothetical protein n=1 Tax=Gilvimarinus sp. 1_MG-2023 TaxID=3062638 RepID=UPI0026E244B3|nr:hypothetical protein [Gilvimarinus sp. 1_MG-2023]MDO6746978.1 hypothetical protein [Gilvimarinus sp. 1_MG-2023]
MAQQKCDYVKGARAAWHCELCNVNFSEQCIPDGYNPQWGKQGPICVKCHSPLKDLDDPSAYLPFWQVVPYLFIYPLHFNALLLMLIGAGGVWLVGGGAPGYIYSFIFSIVSIKYFLTVISKRAEGRRWAPSLIELAKPDPHMLFLQLIGVYVLFSAGTLAATLLAGVWLGLASLVFITAALPACVMILAIDRNMFSAVNPARLFPLILEVGIGPYFALWLMTAAIGGMSSALSYWLEPQLSEVWLLPVLTAIGLYFSLVLHALLGYVLFQYRDTIAGASLSHNEPKLEGDEFRKARLLGAMAVFEKMGDIERLRQPMRDLLDVCRDDLEVHRRYQGLLMRLNNDPDALAKHTDYLLGLLLDAKKNTEALALVKDVYALFAGYRLRHAPTALKLARLLTKKKEPRLLVQVTANLHKRVTATPEVAAVYLLVAQALAGPLAEPAKAKAVVAYTLKVYPTAPESKALAKLSRSL